MTAQGTIAFPCLLSLLVMFGCTPAHTSRPEVRELFAPAEMPNWRPCPRYRSARPWTLTDGVFYGHGSYVGHKEVYDDFVLECDFLFDGKAEGGIGLRSSRTARRPWEVGYDLDIDWAPDRKHGRIGFPVKPKSYKDAAWFEVGKWHSLRVEARGPRIVVHLDGKKVLAFEDKEHLTGQICLEGASGGVKYRNLRVTRLK